MVVHQGIEALITLIGSRSSTPDSLRALEEKARTEPAKALISTLVAKRSFGAELGTERSPAARSAPRG